MVIFMSKPLALKLAPKCLDEVIGQKHLIGKDKLLLFESRVYLRQPLPCLQYSSCHPGQI